MKIDDPTKFTFGENDKNEITEEDNYLKDFSLKNNVVGDYSENENANTNFHFNQLNGFVKKNLYLASFFQTLQNLLANLLRIKRRIRNRFTFRNLSLIKQNSGRFFNFFFV